MLLKNLDTSCAGELMLLTIGLKGASTLWIFGRPYNLEAVATDGGLIMSNSVWVIHLFFRADVNLLCIRDLYVLLGFFFTGIYIDLSCNMSFILA